MKHFLTLSLSLLAASVAGSAFAENPYAPTGNETVIGQTQVLCNPGKVKKNILTGTECGASEGWSVQCMNTAKNIESGSTMTVGTESYIPMKFSNGAEHTITLPEGYVANAVTIYATINKEAATARPCYWAAIDGTTYPAPETDHITSFKDFANPTVSYFKLSGDKNTFTIKNGGEQPFVVLVVDYSEKAAPAFGEGALAVSNVWPKSGNTMLPLQGEFVLTFPADVTVAGKADLNGTALDMTAEGATVKIPFTGLTAATEYTLTIPAKTIGNAEGANEALTYTFTTRPANVLFYSDFKQYPYAYYKEYGNISKTVELFGSTSATDVTKDYDGMIFFSGTSGRCAIMSGVSNSADLEADYGPHTEADAGASDYCAQMIGGSGSYIQFPEVEGPVELTFYIANPDAKNAPAVKLTDEEGDIANPLETFNLPKAKRMKKFTYSYPYKGKVSFRIYNGGKKIDVNDVLIVKGEGEGIDKPADVTAPELVKSWPSEAPYAPVEGTIVLEYNEDIVVTGKATVNGVETDVVVNGKKATIAYSGLENGKAYTVNIPAVADEAGNATEATTMTINTVDANVLYYTDYNFFPYEYWTKYNKYPTADGTDNGDILAKNSVNKTAEVAGLTYVVGATRGRVVAMGKSNLCDDPDGVNASQRCAQFSGGGNGLYVELPEVLGPCKLTITIGNSTAKAFDFSLVNAADAEAPAATFATTAEKKMFKFEHTVNVETPVKFRLYNNGNQYNLHDVLLTKVEDGTVGVADVAAEAEAPAVYYNLQGVCVENPAEGLYIRVRGNKVDKVLVK